MQYSVPVENLDTNEKTTVIIETHSGVNLEEVGLAATTRVRQDKHWHTVQANVNTIKRVRHG